MVILIMIQLFFIDNSSAHMKCKQQCQSENYSITLTRPVDSATTERERFTKQNPITQLPPTIQLSSRQLERIITSR